MRLCKEDKICVCVQTRELECAVKLVIECKQSKEWRREKSAE